MHSFNNPGNVMTIPQLCCDAALDKLNYPVLMFPKIDGVRLLNLACSATARTLKKFKNRYITNKYSAPIYEGFDGEGTYGSLTSKSLCRDTTSVFNTIEGEPDIQWNLFDWLHPSVISLPYKLRYKSLCNYVAIHKPPNVKIIPCKIAKNEAQVLSFYHQWLAEGYEGAVIRDPLGMHKDGRATAIEANYMRLKPSSDKEALVLSVVEAMKNNNEKVKNELGHSERSSHKENLEPKGMIGTLICLDLETKQIIRVGAGKMKHSERIYFFEHPEEIQGLYIKYRSVDTGVKDAPRFGRFICIRPEEDIVF